MTFAQAIEGALSPDNQIRVQAEAFIDQMISTRGVDAMTDILSVIESGDPTKALLSAVILRKKYIVVPNSPFYQSEETERFRILNHLLSLVNPADIRLAKNLTAILMEYENQTDKKFELSFKKSAELLQNDDPKAKILGFDIIESLASSYPSGQLIESNMSDIASVFNQYLDCSANEVRVAALRAIAPVLSVIKDDKVLADFSSVIPKILASLTQILDSEDIEEGSGALSALADLVEGQPKIWKPYVSDVLVLLAKLLGYEYLSDELREISCEFFNVVTSACAAAVRKSSEFSEKTFPALVQMMLFMEEESLEEWYGRDDDDDLVSRGDAFSLARQCIVNVTGNLGAKTVLPHASQMFNTLIAQSDWKNQYAALYLLSMLMEGCSEMLKPSVSQLLEKIVPAVSNPEPRVQYAALTTIAIICLELGPEAQLEHHETIIRIVSDFLKPGIHPKLRTMAATTICNFMKPLIDSRDEENLSLVGQYCGPLLGLLAAQFEETFSALNVTFQQKTLGAISSLAHGSGPQFGEYYNTFVPAMVKVLSTEGDSLELKSLKAETIECLGFMVGAVAKRKDEFKDSITEILTSLINLQDSNLTDDDPRLNAITSVYGHFAEVLKEEFQPFMATIVPKLLAFASLDINFSLKDVTAADVDDEEGTKSLTFDIQNMGKAKVSLKVSALEHKISACDTLHVMASATGKAFNAYTLETSRLMSVLTSFHHSDAVKKSATKISSYLLSACNSDEEMVAVFANISEGLIRVLKEGIQVISEKYMKRSLKEMRECLSLFKTVDPMPLDKARDFVTDLEKVTDFIHKNIKEIRNDVKKAEDQEEVEDLSQELEKCDNLLNIVMENFGYVNKTYGARIADILQPLGTHFYMLLKDPEASEGEMLSAVCFFCDLFEYGIQDFPDKLTPGIADTLFTAVQGDDTNVQQSIAYLFGVIAHKISAEIYANYHEKILAVLQAMLSQEDAMSEDNANRTENAIGAYLKIGLFKVESIVPHALSLLPLTHDAEEAQAIHKLFCKEVSAENRNMLGADNANMAAIKEAYAKIVKAVQENTDEELADAEGKALLESLQGQLA